MINHMPYKIPLTEGVAVASVQTAQYSKEVRQKVTALVMNLAKTEANYNSRWTFGMNWETDGTRLHKRIANAIYKETRVRMPDDLLQEIATIAAQERDLKIYHDVTDRFQWTPGDFSDNNSCYWTTYTNARVMYLPKLGTVALRTYNGDGANKQGTGRCWLTPIPPDENDGECSLIAAWNFYGALQNGDNLDHCLKPLLGADFAIASPLSWAELTIDSCYINNGRAVFFKRNDDTRRVPTRVHVNLSKILGSRLPFPDWTLPLAERN